METLHVATTIRGRVLVDAGERADWLLIGFHGYAQTADDMMACLRAIAVHPAPLRVSVQGLHHFYAKGKPGSSWMTSQDRNRRISENSDYVGRVLDELRLRLDWRRLAWCGFSQGAAMAYRAAARHGGDLVIVNGGDVPPDIEHLQALPPVLIGRGIDDPAYPQSGLDADIRRLQTAGCQVQHAVVPGGHEWNSAWNEAIAGALSADG